MRTSRLRIGGHVSAAGKLVHAIWRAREIGANTIQLFGSSPRTWLVRAHSSEAVDEFKRAARECGISPIFLHASYLLNLASPDESLRKKSEASLHAQLGLAGSLGADGLIFHIGSGREMPRHEAMEHVIASLARVAAESAGNARLIIENSAGGGQSIGSTVEEIGMIMERVAHPRLGACFDTAHAFEAGIIERYTPETIARLCKDIARHIGFERLLALHVNDSKSPFNSRHDRHENIGEGHIGKEAFGYLINTPQLARAAWILEVPGFDGTGPDRKNIDILRSLIQQP